MAEKTETTILNDSAVSEIEDRANAAEPGPWQLGGNYWDRNVVTADKGDHFIADCGKHPMSAEFIAHAREDIPALCDTVKHLRAERLRLLNLVRYCRHELLDNNLITRDEFVSLLNEGSAAHLETYDELQSQLEQLRAENEALKKWQRDVEEREAAACPEDVPFDEYIWALKKRAAQAREERDELSTELETCHSLLDQFYAEDPVMTSADTLEKRLKLHLDELRPVITDDDVNGDD